MPVLIHDQVAALEVPVHDGRAVGVQVEHPTGRLGAEQENTKTARHNNLKSWTLVGVL